MVEILNSGCVKLVLKIVLKNECIGPSVSRILRNKEKYSGSLINNNQAGNRWERILEKEYEDYPRNEED